MDGRGSGCDMDSYNIGYSVDAFGDFREIYSYIANELLVPETAAAQLGRIVREILCFRYYDEKV